MSGKDKSEKKDTPKKKPRGKKPTLKEQLNESQDKFLRKAAEFDNFRKRSFRDVQDARAYAKIQAIEEFLNIYDTFKMALQAKDGSNVNLEMLTAGLNMIQNEFSRTFSNLGVEEFNVKEGDSFDPQLHNAIGKEFHDKILEGLVIRQQRCGYKMGDKLIRPATLTVSQGLEEEKNQGEK